MSQSQNSHRQYRAPKHLKGSTDDRTAQCFRLSGARFEAGRSFDLEDDMEFCPNLLTNDEVYTSSDPNNLSSLGSSTNLYKRQSIYSGSSDRSSLSSGSPDSSPTQHQIQPHNLAPSVSVASAATPAFVSPPTFISNMANINNNNNTLKNSPTFTLPSPSTTTHRRPQTTEAAWQARHHPCLRGLCKRRRMAVTTNKVVSASLPRLWDPTWAAPCHFCIQFSGC